MNMLSRDELAQSRDAYEEGAECRARTWLFFAYLVATAAVATGVTMLVKGQATQNLNHAGVVRGLIGSLGQHIIRRASQGALLQSCLIVLSSLLLWAFRTDDDAGNGYGFIA